jgi:peptidoglycan/LPS O-acetylase OafA/YrhL
MPEIDGLRFLAIISVLLFHFNGFIFNKSQPISNTVFLNKLNFVLGHGHLGVELFFVISGFILALPFANSYLKSKKKDNIKSYFTRRLTRLEPPYILIMIFFLF